MRIELFVFITTALILSSCSKNGMDGTWSTGCTNRHMFDATERSDDSYIATVTINGDAIELTWDVYDSTNNCTKDSATYVSLGTFKNIPTPEKSQIKDVQTIEMRITKRINTVHSASGDSKKECDTSNITSCEWLSRSWGPFSPVGYLKVDGDKLFIGSPDTGSVDEMMGVVPLLRK